MKIEKWVVREHVEGVPDVQRIYEKVTEDVEIKLEDDEMLFKTLYVSVDTYLQGITLDTPLGNHMGADTIMEVLQAGPRASFKPGDLVQGFGGWRSHLVGNGAPALWQTGTFPMVFPAYRKLDVAHYDDSLPLSSALGVLGGPGMTAWGTLNKFMTIKEGDTVVISGASGMIGALVGQMAKRAGAHVVGTAGSAGKAEYLRELGFDEIIDYKQHDTHEKMSEALSRAAPKGVDKYFDCIGGLITDVVFSMLNVGSQVAICWQWATQVHREYTGPRLLPYIMFPRATIRGIFSIEWFTEANWNALRDELGGMIRRDELTSYETIRHGFDDIPSAYHSLFVDSSANRGKVLVKL